jgi:hypothetical protein
MKNAIPSWMSGAGSEVTAWRIVTILSIVEAGAYVGNEAARYFWDLTAYVEALDTLYPYRFDRPYPFLYPPFAADLFRLAKSHLFELFSIAYVAALALFLSHGAAGVRRVPRQPRLCRVDLRQSANPALRRLCCRDRLDRLLWPYGGLHHALGSHAGIVGEPHPVVDREFRRSAICLSVVGARPLDPPLVGDRQSAHHPVSRGAAPPS